MIDNKNDNKIYLLVNRGPISDLNIDIYTMIPDSRVKPKILHLMLNSYHVTIHFQNLELHRVKYKHKIIEFSILQL